MAERKLGSELCDIDRWMAEQTFIHRYTGDYRPQWASKPRPDGSSYKPHFASDADWLAHTFFQVRRDGRLDLRARSCESFPTWPQGKDDWS